jgi:purine-binding chemotaxis protein CheW
MTSHSRKFLIFSVIDSLYALDLKQVAEVGDPPQLWPIPMAPTCYSGALSYHGDIIAVMNMAHFLRLKGSLKPGKIIVLHQEVASLAFLVDTVIRIISEDEISVCAAPDNHFASAKLVLHDGEAILLNLEALVHNAENGMQRIWIK